METLELALRRKIEDLVDDPLSVCYQCGTCTALCPMSVPVRSLLRGAQLGIKEAAVDDPRLWYCATCRLCEVSCPRGVKITDAIHAMRVVAFENRKAPPKLEEALWGVYENGNPWGGKKAERGKWAEGMALGGSSKPAKLVLYAGCAASYDPRLQRIARSLAEILKIAGADFTVMGDSESCCGDVAYQVGEEGYLEELVQGNIKALRGAGETVVSVSPHCHHMFESVYPKYGEAPRALHYTQLLSELVEQGAVKAGRVGETTLTYHDPCYLGRYHGVFEEPRKILESVPGVKVVEMSDTKMNSTCCGGGGGLMWTELEGERPARGRVSQAAETGATVMATSCPYCVLNFEDAAKVEGRGMKVRDVTEVLHSALTGREL